ncbi:hypothetical protein HHK36_014611 [Tetracentron sinense]|uniref:Uracil-DNA glycosylase-like domain-containing protein n=1 Tax=Tetracentron sinense TaxID=13715 RepID=A0A834Z5W1_TETSI|nr:hypothetical protein HHK36_014611 [Tetracentron sinense]
MLSSSSSSANSPPKMASSKALMEFFQPAKRLKITPSSSETLIPKLTVSSPCHSAAGEGDKTHSPSSLTLEQKTRIEFNKSLARSKRNLRICTERVSKSKGIPNFWDFVKLEELLVEGTWLEALTGEFQKPYAKNLCKFVEQEVRASVPIYPPQYLFFNALNSTPFNGVKVVILGQDPYHGLGQAMGLAFSVPEGVKVPSSLVNIFKELKQDLGCTIPSHGNLERWAVQVQIAILFINIHVHAFVPSFRVLKGTGKLKPVCKNAGKHLQVEANT